MNALAEVDNLATDLKKVIRDSEDVLAAVAGERAEAVREQLNELVAAARKTLCEVEEKAKKGLATADDTIRANPYQAIGVAAAVGVIIGVLIAKK